eukprot:6030994-Pyramimonas_sp.AAC.1
MARSSSSSSANCAGPMKTRKTPSDRLACLLLDSHFSSQNIVAAGDVLGKIDPEFAEFFKSGVCSWLANAGIDAILENVFEKGTNCSISACRSTQGGVAAMDRAGFQTRSWPSPPFHKSSRAPTGS